MSPTPGPIKCLIQCHSLSLSALHCRPPHAAYDECYGENICKGTDWDGVSATADIAGMYGMTVTMFAILVTAANMFFVFQSHVAVRLSWKLMLAVPCLLFLQPIIQAAVSIKAGVHRSTGIAMYDRAARDKECNAAAGTENLEILDSWGLKDDKDLCNDWKKVGAPDENAAGGGGRGGGGWGNPCKPENAITLGIVFSFIVTILFYVVLYGYLIFHTWSFKEELVKQPSDGPSGTQMPATATATPAQPAVAVATPVAQPAVAVAQPAVAVAQPAVAVATPAVAVATAVATPSSA